MNEFQEAMAWHRSGQGTAPTARSVRYVETIIQHYERRLRRMVIEGDIYETDSTRRTGLAVARSAEMGKLIVVVSSEEWPASMYLPAVLTRDEVIDLRDSLTRWIDGSGKQR